MAFNSFLKFLNIVKLLHWTAKSHSVHKVLDELYEEMSEKIDEYVECYIGFFPHMVTEPTIDGMDGFVDAQAMKLYLVKEYEIMQSLAKKAANGNTALLSLVDDMDAIMARKIYLLKMCGDNC